MAENKNNGNFMWILVNYLTLSHLNEIKKIISLNPNSEKLFKMQLHSLVKHVKIYITS